MTKKFDILTEKFSILLAKNRLHLLKYIKTKVVFA